MGREKKDKKPSFYNDLKEFTKLRLATLVVFSASITYITAFKYYQSKTLLHKTETDFDYEFNWFSLIWLCLGGMLVTISSNGFNQILERDLDKKMDRTKNRPLPTGRLSLKTAWILTLINGVAGTLILWFKLNPLTGFLGLASLISYSFIYTPMKQKSSWAVFIGAFPGAAPPLIGWAAFEATYISLPEETIISPAALLLFFLQFMWQFPHFWAIAWRCHEDYKKAGFHLLPSKEGKDFRSAFQILLYTLFMIPIAMLPCFPESGIAGFTTSLIVLALGIIMLYPAIMLLKTLEDKWATKLMFASFIYLPLVLLSFLAHQYY